MELNTFDDIVKMQQEFSSRLAARLKALPDRAATTPDALAKEKRALLDRTIEATDELYRARVEAVKRLDDEIERNKQLIIELERGIIEYDKAKDASSRAEPNESDLATERTAPTDKAKKTAHIPELYTPVEEPRPASAKKDRSQRKKRGGGTTKKATKK